MLPKLTDYIEEGKLIYAAIFEPAIKVVDELHLTEILGRKTLLALGHFSHFSKKSSIDWPHGSAYLHHKDPAQRPRCIEERSRRPIDPRCASGAAAACPG